MSIDDIVKETINIIRRHITGDYHILLFGSLAKGSALDTSDVDIAIMGNQKIPWNVMVRILEDKESIRTLRSVDVVDLRAKSKTFRDHVLSYAKRIS